MPYKDKEVNRKYQKEWRLKRGDHHKEYMRWYHIKREYNLSKEDYQALLEKQNYVCALCKRDGKDSRYGVLQVDHCHTTNVVRGLLCAECNYKLLPMIEQSPGILENITDYLKVNKEEQVEVNFPIKDA